jgi:hypothetical protein
LAIFLASYLLSSGRTSSLLEDRNFYPGRKSRARGLIRPFGIFRGDGWSLGGEPGCSLHSIAHRPTRRIIATLPYRRACKALAGELAALRIDWQEIDPEKVLGEAPDRGKAQAVIRLFEKLTRT